MLRFTACCDRAYSAALKLAAWAAGRETESLKALYEESCNVNWFDTIQQTGAVPNDDDMDEDMDEEEYMARNQTLGAIVSCVLFF